MYKLDAENMNEALSKYSKILTDWASIGSKFNHSVIIPDWHSIEPFITSCQKFLEHLKKETETLLEESSNRLSPFQDPFYIDFSSNRWFAGNREEGYSDWFAWIIKQLEDHRLVFRLLDIDDDSMMKECEGKPDVTREEWAEEGHEGQGGRLDITIRYKPKLLIHVEVKVVSAEEADLGKNAGYKKSLEKCGGEQYHRLLITEAEDTSYDGYEVLKWADICIKLREMVFKKQIEQPLVASLVLSFAGAIEQNLLGFHNINAAYFDSRTFDYIKRFLEGGRNYDKI